MAPTMNSAYDPTPPLSSEYREKNARAARPKDAATLIVIRRRDTPEILMGRRASSHKFMPNKFVFPGGKLDVADQRLRIDASLQPHVLDKLQKHTRKDTSSEKLTGLALAAIRETYEETGLIVGRPTKNNYRSKNASWSKFFAHSVEPALESLELVARAITPTYRVRRFDTRFFMVDDAAHYVNEDSLANASGELEELHWVPVHQAPQLDLPGVTRWIIDQVSERLTLPPQRRATLPAPFVQFSSSGQSQRML